MTAVDRVLDVSVLIKQQPVVLYRIARARYANLDGVGAALSKGRWNRLGQSAIYTSMDVGVPLLERLVHTPKDVIPSNLAMMNIQVQGEWVRTATSLIDSKTRGYIKICSSLAEGKIYFDDAYFSFSLPDWPFALAVPSVIVPAWNVVLYPQARGFWEHVSLLSVEPFHFDPRLFTPEAVTED